MSRPLLLPDVDGSPNPFAAPLAAALRADRVRLGPGHGRAPLPPGHDPCRATTFGFVAPAVFTARYPKAVQARYAALAES